MRFINMTDHDVLDVLVESSFNGIFFFGNNVIIYGMVFKRKIKMSFVANHCDADYMSLAA